MTENVSQVVYAEVCAALCLAVAPLAAQDPFEIVVYPAATAAPGEWELDTHLNYTARGTTAFDTTVAPSQHPTHLTFELTHGIAADWEASAYLLTAYRPGVGAEYAGWRLRSRLHAPARWNLPLRGADADSRETVRTPAPGSERQLRA